MQVVNESDPRVTPSQNGITYVDSEMRMIIAMHVMTSWTFRRLNNFASSRYNINDNHCHLWVLPVGGGPRGGALAGNG